MAPKKWRGQEAVLEIGGGSMPTDPIGVLQEVTISPDVSRDELTGTGDTRFVDVMETDRAFEVTGTVMAWDIETWDRAIEWDEAAGETGGSADVDDDYTATVTLEAADGSTKEVGFINGYFPTLPDIGGSREDWMGMEITLRFRDVDTITNTDASSA